MGSLTRFSDARSRSISAENKTGEKGKGGMATLAGESFQPKPRSAATRQLTNRLGSPLDVAPAALFLASDESAFVLGSGLRVDGGLTGAGTIIRGGVARGVPGPDEIAKQFRLEDFPEPFREQAPQMLAQARQHRQEWERTEAWLVDLLDGMPRMEFLLRFTLSHPDVHTTIVGTANRTHLAANVAAAAKGPLLADIDAVVKSRLDDWGAA